MKDGGMSPPPYEDPEEAASGAPTAAAPTMSSAAARDALQMALDFDSLIHDMRSPMQILGSGLEFLEKSLEGNPLQEQVRRLSRTSDAARILFDQMTLARPGAEIVNPVEHASTFDLSTELVEIVVAMLRDHVHVPGVQLINEVAPVKVTVYRAFLYRAVQNLVANSVKHAYSTWVKIQSQVTDTNVTLLISDDGKGMPFDVFARAAQAARYPALQPVQMRGRGLPVSIAMIELLGGTVDLKSSRHGGTCWTIKVPQVKPRALLAGAKQAGDLLKGKVVVILDDSPANALEIGARFHALGAEVLAVQNELDLLILMQHATVKPNLLLLDLVLGDDGLLGQAVHLLRRERDVLDSAVILTAHPGHAALVPLREHVAGVLPKPLTDSAFAGLCSYLTQGSGSLRKALGLTVAR